MASETSDEARSLDTESRVLEELGTMVIDAAEHKDQDISQTLLRSDAAAHGLEVDSLGVEEVVVAALHKDISKLIIRDQGDAPEGTRDDRELAGLARALDHACNWAFVTGYKKLFDARLGVEAGSTNPRLIAYLSFKLTEDMSRNTKVWVAQQILSLMRRYYFGDITFPESILFVEEKEPLDLLLECSLHDKSS
ncbi:hypothetical protein F5X98DRAFT_371487 [Xylaria grammica]|nr:hypothetical protein F5X98DRAFT_371487 [Xylaria grammica]